MKANYRYEIKTWNNTDLQTIFAQHDPILFELLKNVVSSKTKFLLIEYPFATKILKNGKMFLPDITGTTIPYNSEYPDPLIHEFIDPQLAILPLGLLYDEGYTEMYWESEHKICSRGTIRPYTIVGTRNIGVERHQYIFKYLWSATSGPRSLTLLPSIKDQIKFNRLIHNYGMITSMPKTFTDQWYLWEALNIKKNFSFRTKFIFFTRELSNQIKTNTEHKYAQLQHYFYKKVLQNTYYERNNDSIDFIWDEFNRWLEEKNIKPKPYLSDIAYRVILVAIGQEFGFIPLTNDTVAPLQALQSIFTHDYKLKFIPNFIYAGKMSDIKVNESLYFSLQYPIFINPLPKKNSSNSDLDDIKAIKLIIEKFIFYLKENESTLGSILIKLNEQVSFDYCHILQDNLNDIKKSEYLIIKDKRFSLGKTDNRPICSSSTFFKGCIKLTKEK